MFHEYAQNGITYRRTKVYGEFFRNRICLVPQTAPPSYFRYFLENGIIKEEPFFQSQKKEK